MEKGDKFKGDSDIELIFEKYDKHGDALFTSKNKEILDDEGYFFLPIHIVHNHLTKVE